MYKVIIAPFSRTLRNGEKNSKNYPWWPELIIILKAKGIYTIQVGAAGEENIGADETIFNSSIDELAALIKSCDLWISVDNFINHFGSYIGKRGIAIFGKSDPSIFGYPENRNILKDRKYLRANQFDIWESEKFDEEVFLKPNEIASIVLSELGFT